MAGILEYSTTAASNTTLNGIGIAGSNSVKNGDDALRQLMADAAAAVTQVVDKSANYTAVKADYRQMIRATATMTLNLTVAATLTAGWCLWVKADGGAVTIDPAGTEKINGANTLTLGDGSAAFIVCTGTAFQAIIFNAAATLGDAAYLNVGTTAGTVAAGDDSRFAAAAPATRTIATEHSLAGGGDLSADRTLSLSGDVAAPGNNKFYGTDGAGARGWQDAPIPDYGAGNAALAVGAIGTYALLTAQSRSGTISPGTTIAGSSLKYAGFEGSGTSTKLTYSAGSSPGGTWRAMGYTLASSGSQDLTTEFLRYA